MGMRMRLAAVLVMMLAATLALSGCGALRGSGNIVTQERSVGNVTQVEVTGIGRLEVTQGTPAQLTVTADDNLMKYIQTESQGDRLVISIRAAGIPFLMLDPTETIVYKLRVPSPESLGLSGSGEIVASDLDVSSLGLDISGSGSAVVTNLKANDFEYRLSGSGKAEVTGETGREDITVSGSGRLTAGDFKAQQVSITVSGSGDATVWAVGSLDVNISGSGTVRYYGSPSVTQHVSGSGNLNNLGTK
jgi:hypothetical protein